MDRAGLWERARDDAGFSANEAVWYELPGVHHDVERDTLFGVAGPLAGHPEGLPLDAAAKEWSSRNRERVRVVTFQGFNDAAVLGGMRWGLEYARLDLQFNAAMNLIRMTHVASQDRIIALGAGERRTTMPPRNSVRRTPLRPSS